MSLVPKVSQLFRYPIKSCKAESVSFLDFDKWGPVGDRRWLITTDDFSDIVTQRKHPKLSKLEVLIENPTTLSLSAPNFSNQSFALSQDGPLVEGNVWKNYFQARDAGDEIAAWLSDFLSQSVRLLATDPNFDRKVSQQPDHQVAFADAYPLLVISEASLDWLNQHLDAPVDMTRFRPNIVLRDCEPFQEDRWQRIQIGDIALKSAGPCTRCIMTTVDPEKGDYSGPEPLKTLSQIRKTETGVVFGQNYLIETKTGRLCLGEIVS